MERRTSRFVVWLPVRVEELAEGMAVTHNASDRGVLLVSASTLALGAAVTIRFQIPNEAAEQRTVHGRVVRVEPNRDDPDGVWRHQLAVEFDETVPELEAMLTQLVRRGIAKISR
jgi:hypothetical protein